NQHPPGPRHLLASGVRSSLLRFHPFMVLFFASGPSEPPVWAFVVLTVLHVTTMLWTIALVVIYCVHLGWFSYFWGASLPCRSTGTVTYARILRIAYRPRYKRIPD